MESWVYYNTERLEIIVVVGLKGCLIYLSDKIDQTLRLLDYEAMRARKQTRCACWKCFNFMQ